MNLKHPFFLCFLLGPIAAFAAPTPVIDVQIVQADSADAYATTIGQINELMTARTGEVKLHRVFAGDFAGDLAHQILVVSEYPSAATVYRDQEKLEKYPEIDALLAQMRSTRRLGPECLCKAMRNEGLHVGGAFFSSSVVCSDEAGYAKALDELRAIFDAHGFKDAKLNLWRVVSGRKDATHLAVFAFPSQLRLAEWLDAIHDDAMLREWNERAAKLRTIIGNGSYHEITK